MKMFGKEHGPPKKMKSFANTWKCTVPVTGAASERKQVCMFL